MKRLADWLRAALRRAPSGMDHGAEGSAVAMVRSYDFATQRETLIPASVVGPGYVQVHVAGVDGVVQVEAARLTPGPLQHPPLDHLRAEIRAIEQAFAEHSPLTLEAWEEGFRRDASPQREVALWLHAAEVYTTSVADERSAERRREIHAIVVACTTTSPDQVFQVVRLAAVTRADAERIVACYFSPDPAAA